MALKPPSCAREDHSIWAEFEPKFGLCYNLYHYKPFFEKLLYMVTKDFVEEMVTVVEYRHIIGGIFSDDGKVIPLAEEFAIFSDCVKKI